MSHTMRLVQDGVVVAKVESDNLHRVLREIQHYALQYVEDGPVAIQTRVGKRYRTDTIMERRQDKGER